MKLPPEIKERIKNTKIRKFSLDKRPLLQHLLIKQGIIDEHDAKLHAHIIFEHRLPKDISKDLKDRFVRAAYRPVRDTKHLVKIWENESKIRERLFFASHTAALALRRGYRKGKRVTVEDAAKEIVDAYEEVAKICCE